MRNLIYLCFIANFVNSCTEKNEIHTDEFQISEPIKVLNRKYYTYTLKLSTGNLKKAIANDQILYDVLKITRNFNNSKDFEKIQNGLSENSKLISRNTREDSLLQRFIVNSELCSIQTYEKTLKENKVLEISGKEISNCLIYKFCKRDYIVFRSDESGMYIVRQE